MCSQTKSSGECSPKKERPYLTTFDHSEGLNFPPAARSMAENSSYATIRFQIGNTLVKRISKNLHSRVAGDGN